MLVWSMRKLFYFVLVLLCAACVFAQDDSVSVAEASRKARENKAKAEPAKKVINDETLAVEKGPIPDLNLEGRDNTEDIIKAIAAYKRDHTPEETERVVREWYNRYDQIMQHASDQNASIRSRQEDDRIQPRPYPDDYQKYREEQLSEARAKVQDDKLLKQNGMLAGRIQSAFYKIKNDLSFKYKLNYDWLKPSSQYW